MGGGANNNNYLEVNTKLIINGSFYYTLPDNKRVVKFVNNREDPFR